MKPAAVPAGHATGAEDTVSVLAVLEMLAGGAPSADFDALLSAGPGGRAGPALTRAVALAHVIRGRAGPGAVSRHPHPTRAPGAEPGAAGPAGTALVRARATTAARAGAPAHDAAPVMAAHASDGQAAFAAVVDTAHDLTSAYDLDTLLRVITRRCRRLLGLDLVCLAFTRADGSAYPHLSDGGGAGYDAGLRLGPGEGLGALVRERRAPVWSADYLNDAAFTHSPGVDTVIRAEGVRGVVAVPLRHSDGILGVLYGADRRARSFTAAEVATLASLADLAAVAIERARLLERARAEASELERFGSAADATLTRVRYLWDCHGRLARLVLDGAGLDTLARTTGDALDGVLQIRDPGGRPLTSARGPAGLDEAAVTRGALHACTARRPVRLPGEVWVAPVTAGAEDLGFLVLHAAEPLTEEDVRLLELAALSVASLILIQRGTAAAEGPVHDELLQELLDRPHHSSDPHLCERTRRLGIDLDVPHVVVVVRPEGGELGRAVAWASSYAYRLGGLKGVRRGSIVLLLPGDDPSEAARQVSAEVTPLLGHPVSTGAAGPAKGAAAVAGVYEEAARCLDALTALDGVGGTASLRELGFLGLLLSADHDVDAFIGQAIGPVLEYDAARFTELTRTLEAYFESGGSPTHAAEALHVHTNTVSRRLERIAELLGEGWQKPAQALEIQMALRLRRTREVLVRTRPRT
ncbi:helix-turn-helix domain-containing protein [Streptomyces sp. G-G2]|uniref:helix-turn-helix domain-containing protein n=1 Tax=Streptomyces sp. G-G2 TaxID=3046201 RepID=UPI0024B91B4A|nr:helix-turn-helix domain-containing protein [Streptomyces sp. G-G2]MDJ0382547.1 helix-turn-helix domain-containing protein [Streptomyces sp. G-G2]